VAGEGGRVISLSSRYIADSGLLSGSIRDPGGDEPVVSRQSDDRFSALQKPSTIDFIPGLNTLATAS